jgi:hypothetical protein
MNAMIGLYYTVTNLHKYTYKHNICVIPLSVAKKNDALLTQALLKQETHVKQMNIYFKGNI